MQFFRHRLLLFFLSLVPQAAVWCEESAPTRRSEAPYVLGLNSGHPGVSWLGAHAALQLQPDLQIQLSHGYFSKDEFQIHSTALSTKVFFVEENLSPYLVLGLTGIRLKGDGRFAGLDSSALLAHFGIGLEYFFEQGLRLSLGWLAHAPIRLQIPFVELGFGF